MFIQRLISVCLLLCLGLQPVWALDSTVGKTVDLQIVSAVSSEHARRGSTVYAKTMQEVKNNQNKVVIVKGSDVQLTIDEVKKRRGHDTAGYVRLAGGSTTDTEGNSVRLGLTYEEGNEIQKAKKGQQWLSALGIGLTFVPFGYFNKGDEAYIPSGTVIKASVLGN
ncbi:MAG: hypothetical protein ACKO34_00245 [Vampirovibrionales bacterium]